MPTRVVQIPLWTIVTQQSHFGCYRLTGSDSSMDDCNPETTYEVEEIYTVQIPLWTIVTYEVIDPDDVQDSSDSSMDDCNQTAAL